MRESKQVLYGLTCGHAAPAPATLVSGALGCAWCKTLKTIVGVITYEWHAKCLEPKCTFSRWAGLSKHNAGVFADGHCRHNVTHKVLVEYAENPVAVRTAWKFKEWQGLQQKTRRTG